MVEAASPLAMATQPAITPWGYVKKGDEASSAAKSACSTGGASWQTIRAGLMSPPPLASSLLHCDNDDDDAKLPLPSTLVIGDKAVADQTPVVCCSAFVTAASSPPPPKGRGGWLVNLVESLNQAA